MQFQVTEIEFDFDYEDHQNMTTDDMSIIEDSVLGTIWEADDEDDLVEEITCATGWCIKSIDYRIILK
jgi:hypothetical protein